MTSLALPKNIASVALVILANIFLIAFSGSQSGASFFFAAVTMTILSFLTSWVFIHDGIRFPPEKSFKYSVGILSSLVLLNGFFTWSQGFLNLNSMLITASQTIVPFLILFLGKSVKDNLLFDVAALCMLFCAPVFFDASETWVLKNSTPITSLPLLISSISAVILFKEKLVETFHLPLGVSRQELITALFVVAATISSLVFLKAFLGERAVVAGLSWSKVLPFGWFSYLIPALFAEVLFRAVFMNWIFRITGSFSFALVCSAVSYGILETGYLMSGSTLALFSGIVLGIFNGIAYHKSGSLTVPILANVGFISTLVLLGL